MPEFPPMQDVKQRIIEAIVDLYRDDHDLFHVDANERSISHKLAEHLQKRFPCWHVDCEYNRRGQERKQLQLTPELQPETVTSDDTEAKTVYPDIIVHWRNTNNNLLVIEIKKTNGSSEEKDRQKLKAFVESDLFLYHFGIFLRLGPHGCKKATLVRRGIDDVDFLEEISEMLRENRLA
jgi:hypothetical protein